MYHLDISSQLFYTSRYALSPRAHPFSIPQALSCDEVTRPRHEICVTNIAGN